MLNADDLSAISQLLDQHLDARLSPMEKDIKSIKLTLENEIRPNIQGVAEGHLDLSRRLQGLAKSNSEFEMLSVRMTMLESKIAEIERKIS